MIRILVVCALLSVTTGCTTRYNKPGGTAEGFEQDKASCEFQAMHQDGVPWPHKVNLCLRGKGWRIQ